MIPINDHNPTTRRAIVVPILIGINIVMFLFVQPTFSSGTSREKSVKQLTFLFCRAAIPYEATHFRSLAEAPEADLGSNAFLGEFQRRDCPGKNVWLAILTSMFLHAGWAHILGNMLYLFVFGNNVEDRLGPLKFALFYLLSGIAATYAQALLDPSSTVPLIGASGAIAGVLGAYLLLYPRARITTLIIFFFITSIELPAIVVLGVWFALQVFQGAGSVLGHAAGGVAYAAHVGGFIAGMLMLLVFRPRSLPAAHP